MSNEIQLFNFNENEIRTILDDNRNIWFCLKDVCDILDLTNSRKVASGLDKDDVTISYAIDSLGRKQNTTFTNESGLYQVVFQSRKPIAKKFTIGRRESPRL